MRQRVIQALKPFDAVSVENPARPGTPDVNIIPGWIELKKLVRWPKVKPERNILIKHFTPQQRVWLRRRCRMGGSAWLLLQIANEWFLFWGETAAKHVGHCTREQLKEHALCYWPAGLNESQLRSALSSGELQ